MNKELLYRYAEAMARDFLAKRRSEDPFWGEAVAWDVGGTENNQFSAFRRTGTAGLTKSYNLPGDIAALIRSNMTSSAPSTDLGAADDSFLKNVLTQGTTSPPGSNVLNDIMGISPTSFQGDSSMRTIMARNPFSTDYEQATSALFDRLVGQARAQAMSGPSNVRGAQDRVGLELADVDTQMGMNRFKEVTEAQNREASIVEQATQIYNTIESMRRGSQMGAQGQAMAGQDLLTKQGLGASDALSRRRAGHSANLAMASEFLGTPTQSQTENSKGFGNQNSVGDRWGTSFSCCFVFIEHFRGRLPDDVRRGRDELITKHRALGYRAMARFVVPWMQRHTAVRHAVDWILVRPFVRYGAKRYHPEIPNKVGSVLRPYCWAWIHGWDILGRILRKDYYHGKVA